ncbi:MAG: uracil-DNA glycosylase [Metallosphaera sp.]|uniref:uracil-DNA glycosylase n=2 Tax=Metallosphaera sp. TaxID=2020860 RepID=UPI00316260B0
MTIENEVVMNDISFLENRLINCDLCKRLRSFSEYVARFDKRYDEQYWGKPVPGFGDKNAVLLILGLAPAAHGGNRTGRPFTGDESGKWVIKGLYELGLSNLEEGKNRNDGLVLKHVYLTNAVSCAPPENKVNMKEIKNCSTNLKFTIEALSNLRSILTLGQVAFRALEIVLNFREQFRHLNVIKVCGKYVISSYHPSPLNTRTGKLSWTEWMDTLRYAWELANA